MISLSQLKLRKRLEADHPEGFSFTTWLHPVLLLLVVAAIVAVLISMGIRQDSRLELAQCLAVWALLTGVHLATRRHRAQNAKPTPHQADSHASAEPPSIAGAPTASSR